MEERLVQCQLQAEFNGQQWDLAGMPGLVLLFFGTIRYRSEICLLFSLQGPCHLHRVRENYSTVPSFDSAPVAIRIIQAFFSGHLCREQG